MMERWLSLSVPTDVPPRQVVIAGQVIGYFTRVGWLQQQRIHREELERYEDYLVQELADGARADRGIRRLVGGCIAIAAIAGLAQALLPFWMPELLAADSLFRGVGSAVAAGMLLPLPMMGWAAWCGKRQRDRRIAQLQRDIVRARAALADWQLPHPEAADRVEEPPLAESPFESADPT